MRRTILIAAILSLLPSTAVSAQEVCSQLRDGLRETDREEAQLCAEYWGTCAFLETARNQLRNCQGDDCVADLMIAVGGCALVIGWDSCNYVGTTLTQLSERRQRIRTIANSNNCVLF